MPNYLYIKNDNNTLSEIRESTFAKTNEIPFEGSYNNIVYTNNFLNLPDKRKITIFDTFDPNLTMIDEILTDFVISSMDVNPKTGILYLINYDSDTVLAIYGTKIVAGVTFNVNPSDSGYIKCNDINFPTDKYLFVDVGTKCIAESNKKFQFNSWSENSGKSTGTLNVSTSSESPLYSILNVLGFEKNDTSKIFTVTDYGNFTANFMEVPPPIPNEYIIPLYGIVASMIIGWSIPSIISWIKSKGDVRKFNYYHKQINTVYDDGKLDEKNIESINMLKHSISNAYAKGKLNEEHYSNLKDEIAILYGEIFSKRIDDLGDLLNNEGGNLKKIKEIKKDINEAFSKDKINEKHYNLLKEKISEFENKK